DINLHFTGDFHAVTTAHNLLSAAIDNHIHHGNKLNIDPREIVWKRVLDMNDRALRNIVVGLGGRTNGVPREDGFDITVASEIMAILGLSNDLEDLKDRVGSILVAYNYDGEPVFARDLEVDGAMTLLLKDAIKPNLVQTLENTPAFVHGGPFANIAHGCNTILATKMAMKLSEYTITEAGFGADLGAEKFFNIKCKYADIKPDAAVIVATIRALKHHGGVGKNELSNENLEALEKGFGNLEKHIENVKKFGVPAIVSINKLPTDTDKEIELVIEKCKELGVEAVLTEVWGKGGDGAIDLANKVVEVVEGTPSNFELLYDSNASIKEKIETIAKEVYGAEGVEFTKKCEKQIKKIEENGLDKMSICMAKTKYSLSDDPSLLARPEGFKVTVREIKASAGAKFLVALTGNIMSMPGLPKVPAANKMDILEDGTIIGLF